jgi:hypothetical protein
MKGRLWRWASLFMGAQLGNLEWAHLSLYGSSVKEIWRESSLAGNPKGYVEKALERGIYFHKGPCRGTWKGAYL